MTTHSQVLACCFRSPGTFYVETAVFVDQDLLRVMKTNFPKDTEEQVIKVVLAMVNAVS